MIDCNFDQKSTLLHWCNNSLGAAVVFCKDSDGELNVLVELFNSSYGKDTIFVPLGPLNVIEDEPCAERVSQNLFELSGIRVEPMSFHIHTVSTKPTGQVWFTYYAVLNDTTEQHKITDKYPVKWVKINELDKYEWTYNHREVVDKMLQKINFR